MRIVLATLLPLAAASVVPRQGGYFSFGNSFSTGPTQKGTFITHATTTIVLPELQTPHSGNLGFWPGMGMDNGDLIQGLAISTVGGGSPCNMNANEVKWCILASTLQDSGQHHANQNFEANPGDKVTYDYKYNPSTQKMDQTISVNGKVVSTLSTSSGRGGLGWGTAMECQAVKCGTVPEHHYMDTKLTFSAPNPDYISTVGMTGSSGNLVTADGGTTWTADNINIDQYTYT